MRLSKKFAAKLVLTGLCTSMVPAAMAQAVAWAALQDAPTRLYGNVGTQGIGVGMAKPLNSAFDLRAGVTSLTYSMSGKGDINADASLKLQNLGVYADWFPFESSGFRFTAGLQTGNNKVEITGKPSANTINVGGTNYAVAAGDSVTGKLDMGRTAPYVGLGWSQHGADKTGLSLNFDLGVRLGKADVSLTANGSAAFKTAVAADLLKEQTKLADDLKVLKTYPVLGLGLSYRW